MVDNPAPSMLALKTLLFLGGGYPEGSWRNFRAHSLVRMIAWHRIGRAETVRRIILEDIVPDIGWPRWKWLFPAVRAEQARIETSLAEWKA